MDSSKLNTYQKMKVALSSQEFILTIVLVLFYNVGTYVCFGFYGLGRSLTFSVVGIFSSFFSMYFILYRNGLMIKRNWMLFYIMSLLLALFVTFQKLETNYFSISGAVFELSIFSFFIINGAEKNLKNESSFIIKLIWFVPFLLMSAFNSSSTIFVICFSLILTQIIFWVEKTFSSSKVNFYILIILFVLTIFLLSVVICFFILIDNQQFFYGSNGLAYKETEQIKFRYLVYKTNLFFSLCMIALEAYLFLRSIAKSLLLKANDEKANALSLSLLLLMSLFFSIISEIFFKTNNGIHVPFWTDGTFLLCDFMTMCLILSANNSVSEKECTDFFANSLRSIFKRGNNKSKMSVFISYRRETGSDLAMHVHDRLKLKGVNSFFDLESMKAGKFNEQIYEKIEECNNFIIILSKDSLLRCSNEGDWVRLEIAHALKNRKHIIPVMTKDFVFPDELPNDIDDMRNYHGITASNEFFDYVIDKLITMLK